MSHFPIAKAFLEHGFHVVMDKPMTFDLPQAEELVRLVEKSGLVFCLTHNYTGHPLVRHARELFHSGEMGKVRKVIVEYLQDFLMYPHEKEGMKQAVWRTDPAQAGPVGTMGDAGTHCENLLEYITGETISEVCADFTTFLPDRVLEEDANLLLRLSGGGKGLMTVSQVATGEENGLTIRIYAEKGGILWAQENPNYLQIYRYNAPRQTISRAHKEYLSELATWSTRVPTGHPEGYLEAFANIYCGAVEAIRRYIDGKPMATEEYRFPTVYDGLRGMRFVTRAGESAKRGSTWVKVLRPPPFARPDPDFSRLEKVLRRTGMPDRVPFYEIFSNIEASVLAAIGDPPLPGARGRIRAAGPRDQDLLTHVRHQYWLGYDFAAVRESMTGFVFPLAARPHALTAEGERSYMTQAQKTIADRWEDFERYSWLDMDAIDYSPFERVLPILPEGMGVIGDSPGVFENVLWLLGYEGLAYLLCDEPALLQAIFDAVGSRVVRYFRTMASFDQVRALRYGDDLGFKTQLLLPPNAFRRLVLPWHRQVVQIARERDTPIILHSCGNLREVLQEIIAHGWSARHSFEDVIEPVWDAKRRDGDRISHLGGFDMVKLSLMTPEQVRGHTRFLIRAVRPRRGMGAGIRQFHSRVRARGQSPGDARGRPLRGRVSLEIKEADDADRSVHRPLPGHADGEDAGPRGLGRDLRGGDRRRRVPGKPPLSRGRAAGLRAEAQGLPLRNRVARAPPQRPELPLRAAQPRRGAGKGVGHDLPQGGEAGGRRSACRW